MSEQQLIEHFEKVFMANDGSINDEAKLSKFVTAIKETEKKSECRVFYANILKRSNRKILAKFMSKELGGWKIIGKWYTEALEENDDHLMTDVLELMNKVPLQPFHLTTSSGEPRPIRTFLKQSTKNKNTEIARLAKLMIKRARKLGDTTNSKGEKIKSSSAAKKAVASDLAVGASKIAPSTLNTASNSSSSVVEAVVATDATASVAVDINAVAKIISKDVDDDDNDTLMIVEESIVKDDSVGVVVGAAGATDATESKSPRTNDSNPTSVSLTPTKASCTNTSPSNPSMSLSFSTPPQSNFVTSSKRSAASDLAELRGTKSEIKIRPILSSAAKRSTKHTRKSLTWRLNEQGQVIHECKFFELIENERCNVSNPMNWFDEGRFTVPQGMVLRNQSKSINENAKRNTCKSNSNNEPLGMISNDPRASSSRLLDAPWRALIPIDFDNETLTPGWNSKERGLEAEREASVLGALDLPGQQSSLDEPDTLVGVASLVGDKGNKLEIIDIPLETVGSETKIQDYSNLDWFNLPDKQVPQPHQQQLFYQQPQQLNHAPQIHNGFLPQMQMPMSQILMTLPMQQPMYSG